MENYIFFAFYRNKVLSWFSMVINGKAVVCHPSSMLLALDGDWWKRSRLPPTFNIIGSLMLLSWFLMMIGGKGVVCHPSSIFIFSTYTYWNLTQNIYLSFANVGAHPEHILSSRANKSEKIDFWYFYPPIQILGHLSRETVVKMPFLKKNGRIEWSRFGLLLPTGSDRSRRVVGIRTAARS